MGTSIITPHLLTPREDMQDTDYESSKDKMSKDPTTPNLPWVLSDFSNLHYSRFDRHQPEQSYAVWSGTTPGLLNDKPADPYDYSAPIKVWDGSTLSLPENTITGTEKDEVITGTTGDDLITGLNGNDVIFGGAGKDLFCFDNLFGSDALVGSTSDDSAKFSMLFKVEDFSIRQNSNDLVIDYLDTKHELTIENWYSSGNAMNCFTFGDNSSYKIESNHFVKL